MAICGQCGSGWIRIRSGFWGCAGVRNGAGCTNGRQISDERFRSRVLFGLKEKLRDCDAVETYVQEYRAESASRDPEEGRVRRKLESKIAEADRRMERLVEAIATGAATFEHVRGKMTVARDDRLSFEEELAAVQSERTIALHPKIADDYRREVRELGRLLDHDTPETREEVIPRLRSLLDSIVITPAATGHGVDIEIIGRLTKMIELATGQPLGDMGMLTLERVKGIEPSS